MFSKCLTWLEDQPEALYYNLLIVLFKGISCKERYSQLKQTKNTHFI